MLWWKFAKFLMSFFEPQGSFSSNFAPLFSVIKDRALYIFSSKNKYFAQKEPIKAKMFETFECSGQNLSNFLCQFWNDKSIYLQILYPSSASWKITPLYFFSSNNLYLAQKEHIKMKILSARVKIHQIPFANSETASQLLFKFCIIFQCHRT